MIVLLYTVLRSYTCESRDKTADRSCSNSSLRTRSIQTHARATVNCVVPPSLLILSQYLLLLGESVAEPVQALVQTIAGGSRSTLDVPLTVTQLVQTQALGHLLHLHGVGKILLVGEDQEHGVAQLILGEHALKLVLSTVLVTLCVIDAVAIVAIHHEDAALGVLVVMALHTGYVIRYVELMCLVCVCVCCVCVQHTERDCLILPTHKNTVD